MPTKKQQRTEKPQLTEKQISAKKKKKNSKKPGRMKEITQNRPTKRKEGNEQGKKKRKPQGRHSRPCEFVLRGRGGGGGANRTRAKFRGKKTPLVWRGSRYFPNETARNKKVGLINIPRHGERKRNPTGNNIRPLPKSHLEEV